MIIKRIMLLSSLLIISSHLQAASTAEDCAAITDDNKRLECYDNFLKKQKEQRTQETPKPAKPVSPETTPAIAETSQPKQSAEETFGSENLSKTKSEQIDELQSQAIGKFGLWEKGMEVTLENGQVWEIVDVRNAYHKITNPKITIEKGIFGSYMLGVEGLNKRFKAKRIK